MVSEIYPSNSVLAVQQGLHRQLVAILSDLFQVPISANSEEVSQQTLEVWDSFNHLRLVLELEERFGIELSDADTLEITSLKKIEVLLRERGVVDL